MIDLVLSTDREVPADVAIYSDVYSEDVLLGGGRISNTDDLDPNENAFYRETGVVPFDTPPGHYQLCLIIDPGNIVDESDESNNSLCQPLEVFRAQPDLQIVDASFPTVVEQGKSLTIELTAHNSGTAMGPGTASEADGYMIDLVLSTDDEVPGGYATFSAAFEEDVLLGAGRISNTADLVPGADLDYRESSTVPLDTPPGDYRLCATIDAGNGVEESDETNNTIYQTLVVIQRTVDVPTAVEALNSSLPAAFSLEQNYPNPFNPSTTIRFSLPQLAPVVVRVFDILGGEQAVLVHETLQAGTYAVDFDASHLASGVYFYRVDAGGHSLTRKLTLVK